MTPMRKTSQRLFADMWRVRRGHVHDAQRVGLGQSLHIKRGAEGRTLETMCPGRRQGVSGYKAKKRGGLTG